MLDCDEFGITLNRIKTRCSRILLGSLIAVVLSSSAIQAEDFSVDLTRLAEVEAQHPLPAFEIDRVPRPVQERSESGMPETAFDVFIRFKRFGDVRLSEGGEAGPSTGNSWKEGMTFSHGLTDIESVKTGWIKDSPDLFIVAWVEEPDGRGTSLAFGHGYVILQLRDRQARVLLRDEMAINARCRGGIMDGTLTGSRFSFDKKRSRLLEQASRYYEKASDRHHDLGHLWKDEGGNDFFVATLDEAITLTYKLVRGELVPKTCSMIYKAQKQDELSEVARFYFGPLAKQSVLLDANPKLAAKSRVHPSGAFIYLDEGTEIRIPLPEKWLIEKFAHGLPVVRRAQ